MADTEMIGLHEPLRLPQSEKGAVLMDEPDYSAATFKAELAAVRSELNALRTDVKDLVAAWKAASGLVKFVKWLSSIVAAVTLIYAAIKGLAPR
jgi:hypothetical protein